MFLKYMGDLCIIKCNNILKIYFLNINVVFDMKSLNLIYNNLLNREQRVKVGETYSSWREILYRVPQRSFLEPLLLNIFLCDLFYFIEGTDIENYADDITPYNANLT